MPTVDTESDPKRTFQSVLTADRVTLLDESVVVGAPRGDGPKGEPKVHLVRENGVIRAIDVTCRCGERIRVNCDYT